jgi:S1-C subfamily serine protease
MQRGDATLARRLRRTTSSVLLAASLFAPHSLTSQGPLVSRPPDSSRSAVAAAEMSAEEIFKRFASRILFLTCEEAADESSLASGVLVSANGFIVTNAHVVERCRSMTATHISGASRRSYQPALKYYDEESDTAVLKIPAEGLDFFSVLGRPLRIGERVYAIGNPRGLEQSISEGIVSGNREQDGVPWIQHSAPISPGSSGGALISSRGELLGINAWTRTESQNLNFAVPAVTLARALSGARTLTGFLDFPPNAELTGTYSGVVRMHGISADFKIVASESKGAIDGCLAVMAPLLGSGHFEGTAHGLQFSFVVLTFQGGTIWREVYSGQRDANKLSGTYSGVPSGGGSEQDGAFVLHRTSDEGLGGGFNSQNCPNDAAVKREAAEQGNASAQLILGHLYYTGNGVSQDYAQAAAWIRKAAEQGNALAQYELGALYHEGHGIPQDYAQAAAWYRKAAEQGEARAQYELGVLYREGHGVPQDDTQGATWYRKAAEQGNATAQLTLGLLYEHGVGVPKDDGESYFWVRLAVAGKPQGMKPEEIQASLDAIASRLTPTALSQAQKRAQEWLAARPAQP